jgi:hypothetical protein
MRVSSNSAKPSPEVLMRSVMASSRWSTARGNAEYVAADDVAGLIQFLLQRLMRAGDRGAHALGMGDDGIALAAEAVDQAADAAFIVAIGALQLVDLGVDQRLQLDRARQSALDAFAHGLHLAAHRLADHHHPVGRQMLRLGQPHGHFGHGLRGDAHLLRAADHDGEAEEQQNRHDEGDDEADEMRRRHQLAERAHLPQRRLEQQAADRGAAADPQQ